MSAHASEIQRDIRAIYRGLQQEYHNEGRKTGRIEGAHKALRWFIIRLGTKRFGPPAIEFERLISIIRDEKLLYYLCDRIIVAESWANLIET